MKKRGVAFVLMASLMALLPGATLAVKVDSCPSDSWLISTGASLLGQDRVGNRQLDPDAFYCFKVVPGAAHDDVIVVGPEVVLTDI